MNIIEKIAELDWTVVDELQHIPRGSKKSSQELLRDEYAAFRKFHRQLHADLPARAALVQAMCNVRRVDEHFKPAYDVSFFFGGSTVSRTLASDPLAAEIQAMAAAGGQGMPRCKEAESVQTLATIETNGAISSLEESQVLVV